MRKILTFDLSLIKKYFSEKNSLTVMTCLFCLVMLIFGIVKEDLWLTVGFGLAFSFAIEVLSHRTRGK